MDATPGPSAPPPPPPPPPSTTGSGIAVAAGKAAAKPLPKTLIVVVVIVVAAAAVLGGLFAAGVFNSGSKSSSSPGGGGGSGETFSQAASAAAGVTGSVSGGPWTLVGGVGTVLANAVTVNQTLLNSSASASGCHSHLLSQASSVTSIPSTSAAPTSGDSDAWVVWYSNASLGILEVAVFAGTATPILVESTYGSCETSVTSVSLPSSFVNSPSAASTAYSNGGSAWIASWPTYDIEEILVPGTNITVGSSTTFLPSTWEVTFTTCNLGAEDGSTLGGQAASQFTASIYSSNGTFERGTTTSTACATSSHGGGGGGGGKSKLSSCVGFFGQENVTATTYWNNGTAVCASVSTLTVGDLTVTVENNTTHAAVATTGFVLEVENVSSGAVLSVYNFGTNSWNATGVAVFSDASVENYFVLVTPASMAGENIVFTATASAPATGSLALALGGF